MLRHHYPHNLNKKTPNESSKDSRIQEFWINDQKLVSNVFIGVLDLTVTVLSYPTTGSRVNPIVNTYKTTIYIVWLIDTIFGVGGDEWDPINWLNPATCLCLPVPIQDLDFQHHMSWSFWCSMSSVKMRVDCSFC